MKSTHLYPKCLFLWFCYLFLPIYSFAVEGCVVGGMYVYNVRNASFNGVPNFTLSDPQINYRVPASSYCIRNVASTRSCYVTSSASGVSSAYGMLVDYSPLPCAVDDYIPFLILATGGLGFLYIRRTSLLKIV